MLRSLSWQAFHLSGVIYHLAAFPFCGYSGFPPITNHFPPIAICHLSFALSRLLAIGYRLFAKRSVMRAAPAESPRRQSPAPSHEHTICS